MVSFEPLNIFIGCCDCETLMNINTPRNIYNKQPKSSAVTIMNRNRFLNVENNNKGQNNSRAVKELGGFFDAPLTLDPDRTDR